jgi:hypothetical protein
MEEHLTSLTTRTGGSGRSGMSKEGKRLRSTSRALEFVELVG